MGLSGVGGSLKIYSFSQSSFNSNQTFSLRFDVTSVPQYKTLTVDNFYISQVGVNPKSLTNAGAITRSYDANTGILTVSISAGTSVSFFPPVNVICVTME